MRDLVLRSTLALTLAVPFAHLSFAQQPSTPPPAPSDAQGPPPAGHMHHTRDPHHEAMALSKRLNLTPDQTTRLEPILADRQSRVEALQSNASLDPKSRHQQMRSIQEDTQTKLAGVLTPNQLQQLKEMRGKMAHRGHGGPDGPGGNGAPPPPPPTAQ